MIVLFQQSGSLQTTLMFPVDVRDFPSFLLTLEEIQSNLDSHNIDIYIYSYH